MRYGCFDHWKLKYWHPVVVSFVQNFPQSKSTFHPSPIYIILGHYASAYFVTRIDESFAFDFSFQKKYFHQTIRKSYENSHYYNVTMELVTHTHTHLRVLYDFLNGIFQLFPVSNNVEKTSKIKIVLPINLNLADGNSLFS